MVLGLIDFLLGGKKKSKVSKTAQVQTPSATTHTPNVQPATPVQGAQVPDGTVNAPTANVQPAPAESEVQFVDSKVQTSQEQPKDVKNSNNPNTQIQQPGDTSKQADVSGNQAHSVPSQKKSISEVIHKLHSELSESKERVTSLVTDIKNVENTVNELGHRVSSLESHKDDTNEKLAEIDENMTKFLSLYELINNQYNPFIDKDSIKEVKPKVVAKIDVEGNTHNDEHSESPFEKPSHDVPKKEINLKGDFDSTLLELDTLNIEEAAGDAVPLTQLKNNTNSLVIILSWLEYMIKRVGIEETRNSLRYYTEVLRWITPEVFFDLDKYLRGMKDKKIEIGDEDSLGVKDHIVSLYFISKLNEKKLDEKLTEAVLQIIKE